MLIQKCVNKQVLDNYMPEKMCVKWICNFCQENFITVFSNRDTKFGWLVKILA